MATDGSLSELGCACWCLLSDASETPVHRVLIDHSCVQAQCPTDSWPFIMDEYNDRRHVNSSAATALPVLDLLPEGTTVYHCIRTCLS